MTTTTRRSKWACCACCARPHKAHHEPCTVHQAPVMTDGDVTRCTCGAWAFHGQPCWYCGYVLPPKPERNPL